MIYQDRPFILDRIRLEGGPQEGWSGRIPSQLRLDKDSRQEGERMRGPEGPEEIRLFTINFSGKFFFFNVL